MLKFITAIFYIIFDYFRYQKNLIKKKEIDKSLFYDLKKNLNKNLFKSKKDIKEHKEHKGNLLIASFVHQLGYIYTDCLIANYLIEIKNLKLIGLMDDNDNTTLEFLNCFNSNNYIFLAKLKILKKIKYLIKSYKILKQFKNVEEFVKFKVNGIDVGECVYDHYIRHSSNPSADNLNFKFLIFLAEALYINDFSVKFFKKLKINYMIMSERQFLPSSIVYQNALKAKVKVISRFSGPKKIGVAFCRSPNEKDDADIKIDKKLLQKFLSKNRSKHSNIGFNKINHILEGKIRNPDRNVKQKSKKNIDNIKNIQFFKILNLDPNKKTCFIFSHNLLDGVLGFKKIKIFKDYLCWLRETLNYINKLDDSVNWVVKEHPSDYGFSKITTNAKKEFEKIIDPKKNNIKFFPKNFDIKIIKDVADCVITLGGSCGTEYPCYGIHAINSSGIFYSENGFTIDYKNKKEYFYLLKNIKKILNKKLTKYQIDKARVHFFLSQIVIKYEHSLLYEFDISNNLSRKEFFNKSIKLLKKYSKPKDNFGNILATQINNSSKHFINKINY
jgi:hypothetical protein